MRHFIFITSMTFIISMIFTSCKTEDNKDSSSNTTQPKENKNENENYFTFKKEGTFYEMDKIMMGSSSDGYFSPINIGRNYYCNGITTGPLPKMSVLVRISDTIPQKLGKFEINAANGIGIDFRIEEDNPNSSHTKKTKYNSNQRGTITLERSLNGISTKGTFEFVGYTSEGTDSITVTDGKFNYNARSLGS